MNILFVGPYRQADGWGGAARDYIKAINATGFNLAIRPIYMANNRFPNVDVELTTLENNRFDKYDVVIQMVLPNLMKYYGDVKNIGLFCLETFDIKYSGWTRHISLMDNIWVFNKEAQSACRDYNNNINVVNSPVDLAKFDADIPKLNTPILQDAFNFYFIGEYIERKNLRALLIAFHREFHKSEPVNLVIKTGLSNLSPAEVYNKVSSDILELKKVMRIYFNSNLYKQEIIITDRLNEEALLQLHKTCHCFVMPSRGEAQCRPAIDALGCGNPVIGTRETGLEEFVDHKHNGFLANSHVTPVITTQPPLVNIYTTRETWQEVDIVHLQSCMRQAYEKQFDPKICKDSIQKFSYTSIGNKIKDILNGLSRN